MEDEEEFDDEADDGRGLSTEQVGTTETTCGLLTAPAYALHHTHGFHTGDAAHGHALQRDRCGRD